MKIDSHVHFWNYDADRDAWITKNMKTLRENFLPHDVEQTFSRNGIDGCVAVQTVQEEVETHFLVELAKTNPIIRAVVGWIDLRGAKLSERLDYFSQYSIIKGYRHIVQGEDDDFLTRKDFQEGVRMLQTYNYTYDILIYPRQLDAAIKFVKALPEQRFVVDHCAKPNIAENKLEEWKPRIWELSQLPNTYCKLSGLFTEATWKQWSAAEFYPYLDVVFEAFGPQRLMFGSDWPVMLLSGIYVQWKSLLEKYMQSMNEDDKESVFGKTAATFYNIA